MITYNRAPAAPQLASPLQNGSTNYPGFVWYNAADADNDVLTYQLQVDDQNDFGSPAINQVNISSRAGATSFFTSTSTLSSGTWYWRVRANDGATYGADENWSDLRTVYIDTVAPSALTDLAADIGDANGEIKLTWSAPGDDALTGTINNGFYQVRYATFGPITEELYAATAGQQQGAFSSFPPGMRRNYANIGGLADSTTYFFAVKIIDDAGNSSPVSLTSPQGFTNAPPRVTLVSPQGGEQWSGQALITWTSDDPNPGDTRTFSVYASTDSGASFGVTVATGLAPGTTYYSWNTRQTSNGTTHRIKVKAVDARGLSGEAASGADFQISNINEAPVVTLLYPVGGETLSGKALLTWSVFDYNQADSHSFDIFVSSDQGKSFGWYFTAVVPSYELDTAPLPNGPQYRIKVVATDSGEPPLSGEDMSAGDVGIDNNNVPPNAFSLVSPGNGSSRSVLDFVFSWENNGDPNREDHLVYTLYYGTSPALGGATRIDNITGDYYAVAASELRQETTYYWKVAAQDPLGLTRECTADYSVYILNRFRSVSSDGRVSAEIVSGLPDNGFLKIEALTPSENEALRTAENDTLGDRHVKSLGETPYRVSVRDIDNNVLEVADISLTLSIDYTGASKSPYYRETAVPAGNLRCAYLNESRRRWELVSSLPSIDSRNKRLTATLSRTGTITLVAALAPDSRLSSVVNYPNPFAAGRETTRIRYVLNEDSDTTVRIYTLIGDLVRERNYSAGREGGRGQPSGYTNEIEWDGRNDGGRAVADGMYLMEIRAGSEKQWRRIGVVK